MEKLIEKIIIGLIKRFLDEEVIANAKKQLIEWLSELAKKTDNQIDDAMVKIIADTIGVPYDYEMPVAPVEELPHNNA